MDNSEIAEYLFAYALCDKQIRTTLLCRNSKKLLKLITIKTLYHAISWYKGGIKTIAENEELLVCFLESN